MKFKTENTEHDVNKENEMNKSLYDLFIDIITLEYQKYSLILSSKFYFSLNGDLKKKKFFSQLFKGCEMVKYKFISFLIHNMKDVPDFEIPKLKIDFENAIQPFEMMAKMEDKYFDKLNEIATKAYEEKDFNAAAFVMPYIQNFDHICCKALSAVKNDCDPNLYFDENYCARKTSS